MRLTLFVGAARIVLRFLVAAVRHLTFTDTRRAAGKRVPHALRDYLIVL
jgi:hypothetical protein